MKTSWSLPAIIFAIAGPVLFLYALSLMFKVQQTQMQTIIVWSAVISVLGMIFSGYALITEKKKTMAVVALAISVIYLSFYAYMNWPTQPLPDTCTGTNHLRCEWSSWSNGLLKLQVRNIASSAIIFKQEGITANTTGGFVGIGGCDPHTATLEPEKAAQIECIVKGNKTADSLIYATVRISTQNGESTITIIKPK